MMGTQRRPRPWILGTLMSLVGLTAAFAAAPQSEEPSQKAREQRVSDFLQDQLSSQLDLDSCGKLIIKETAFVSFKRWMDLEVGVYQIRRDLPQKQNGQKNNGDREIPREAEVSAASIKILFKDQQIELPTEIPRLKSLRQACGKVKNIADDLESPCLGRGPACYEYLSLRPDGDGITPDLVLEYRILVPGGTSDPGLPSDQGWTWKWQTEIGLEQAAPLNTPLHLDEDPEGRQKPSSLEGSNPTRSQLAAPLKSFDFINAPCQDATNYRSRLVAPVFHNHGRGGTWSFRPLAGAMLTKGRNAFWTEDDGSFCAPLTKTLKIYLRTERFTIFGLDGRPISQKHAGRRTPQTNNNPPYVLSSRGDPWQEVEHATALFRHLNQVLDFFDTIAPTLDREERPLHVQLTAAFDGSDCHAQMEPGTIRLPLICRSDRFFEPKALCPEIITHEAAHEYFNRLLYASLGKKDLGVHLELGEALADFLAMVYQKNPVLGRFCSGELRRTPFEMREARVMSRDSPTPGLQLPGDTWKIAFRLWQLGDDVADALRSHTLSRPVPANPHVSEADNARFLITHLLMSTILWGGEEATYNPEVFINKLNAFVRLFDHQGHFGGKLVEAFEKRLKIEPAPEPSRTARPGHLRTTHGHP